jgi:hypothetical protein
MWMKYKKYICLIIAMLVIVSATANLSAQQKSLFDFSIQPLTCEENVSYIANALTEGLKSDDSLYVIVIARLGDGERSKKLNTSRQQEINGYLKMLRVKNVVTAEGERKKGLGQLEFYIAGNLLLTLPVTRNSKLDLTACWFL